MKFFFQEKRRKKAGVDLKRRTRLGVLCEIPQVRNLQLAAVKKQFQETMGRVTQVSSTCQRPHVLRRYPTLYRGRTSILYMWSWKLSPGAVTVQKL